MTVVVELFCILFCILIIAAKDESAPVNSKINSAETSLSAMNFMKKYGYLESGTADSEALYQKNAITEAVATLQKFGNIPVTGQLDNATLELIASPRCGVPDILRKNEDVQRVKRYMIDSDSWKERDITYLIPKLEEEVITDGIEKAGNKWNGYTKLNFKGANNPNAEAVQKNELQPKIKKK